MTVDYYPPAIYSFLVKLQEENKLGMKELKTMIIRKVLEDLGLDCPHLDIGYSPKTKKPYCKRCWTRLTQKNQAIAFKGKLIKSVEYEPEITFLNQFYKEREEHLDTKSREYLEEMNNPVLENLNLSTKNEDII